MVLGRDRGVCYRCYHPNADQVDHLVGIAEWERSGLGGSPDVPENLAAIHGEPCPTCGRMCHWEKTSQEAAAAAAERRKKLFYPSRPHPSL